MTADRDALAPNDLPAPIPDTPPMATDAAAAGQPGAVTAPPLEPPASDAAPTDPAPTATAPTSTAPVAAGITAPGRRVAAARGMVRLAQFAFGVGLFVVGVWLGTLAFQATQVDPQTLGAGAVSNGVPTPPVVEEFATALASGGPDAVRSSLSTEVFALLASELSRWDYASIGSVEVLSTTVDGPRSATGLVMTGTTSAGATLSINLIVHTDGGKISTLR